MSLAKQFSDRQGRAERPWSPVFAESTPTMLRPRKLVRKIERKNEPEGMTSDPKHMIKAVFQRRPLLDIHTPLLESGFISAPPNTSPILKGKTILVSFRLQFAGGAFAMEACENFTTQSALFKMFSHGGKLDFELDKGWIYGKGQVVCGSELSATELWELFFEDSFLSPGPGEVIILTSSEIEWGTDCKDADTILGRLVGIDNIIVVQGFVYNSATFEGDIEDALAFERSSIHVPVGD